MSNRFDPNTFIERRRKRILKEVLIIGCLTLCILGAYICLTNPYAPINQILLDYMATLPPTTVPTATFTPEPTIESAVESTIEPTAELTAESTAEPTAVPTPELTAESTAEPTAVPTAEPTAVPTAEPTAVPTAEPTAVPTAEPTAVPTAEPTAVPTPEPTPVALELPYYIEVDRGMQVVRVFTIGEDGQYSLLVRQMICSTDRFGYKPKNGLYELDGEKKPWLITLVPDTYAQYATRISNTILFHSLTYSLLFPDQLIEESYYELGHNVSAGCVRLLAEDAKWIFDNVPPGTPIRFMESERDDELLQQLAPPPLQSGKWDPTDPAENNPDYDPSYAARFPEVTPALGVTPAPTEAWIPQVHATPTPD